MRAHFTAYICNNNNNIIQHQVEKDNLSRSMEQECMRACMRKLAIWHTPNFKPITTHDELDEIMSSVGFTPLPPVSGWKEYSFPFPGSLPLPLPLPRIPYPRIDGLHVNTYRSFLDSLNVYLRMNNISDLFHIRGVPLHHGHDRNQKWLRMARDDLVYVYREGTMDMSSATTENANKDHKYREGTMNIKAAACKSANKDQDAALVIVPWKNIMGRIF